MFPKGMDWIWYAVERIYIIRIVVDNEGDKTQYLRGGDVADPETDALRFDCVN